jgi:hypothetical protein
MKSPLKILLFVILISYDNSILTAQPITWQRLYGGTLSEYGRDGIQTIEGGYILLAKRQNIDAGTLLIKLDPFGNEEWSRIVDNTSTGVCIRQTKDSGFVIAGSNNSLATLIKTDKLGNLIWRKTYTISNQSSWFSKMKLLNNDNLIMCGGISLPGKAYFVKTDSSGNIIWEKTFSNSPSFTIAYDITSSNDSYLYTTGVTSINGFAKTLIGKIGENGNFLWFKNYGSEGKGDAQSGSGIICHTNNILFICGQKDIFYDHRGHFTKLDSSGNIIFQNDYNSASDFISIVKDQNKYILCGSNGSVNKINLMAVNDQGSQLFNKLYSFNTIDELTYAYSLNSTSDNGFFVTGSTTYLGSKFDLNIIAIKTDSLGNTIVSINNSNSVVQNDFFLNQNYPNPFNPKTIINYQLRSAIFVSLKVFNIMGKEVDVLVYEKQKSGFYSVVWNASELPSSIYFYKLSSINSSVTKRMVLIK